MTIPDAAQTLDRDLRSLFGERLKSLVVYRSGGNTKLPIATLAVVSGISAGDLRACASQVPAWHDAGLATPLLVAEEEFGRSLDAFPFEFGGIMADYNLVSGVNPFDGLSVRDDDLRRACEVEARSHLLHLREGYLEAENRGDLLAELIVRSAGPLAALLRNVSLLRAPAGQLNGLVSGRLSEVAALVDNPTLAPDRAREIFPGYLEAVSQLTNFVDRWNVNGI